MSGSSKKSGHTGRKEKAAATRLSHQERATQQVAGGRGRRGRDRIVRPDGAIVRNPKHRRRSGGTGR